MSELGGLGGISIAIKEILESRDTWLGHNDPVEHWARIDASAEPAARARQRVGARQWQGVGLRLGMRELRCAYVP